MVKDHHPLTRIYDFLDQLRYEKYFTKLNLRSGYHQVRIVEEDIRRRKFKTKQRFFEWLVTPFSLTNSLATFMRVMNDVLRPFIDNFCIFYLDDVLVFRKLSDEHVMHVNKVCDVLIKEQFFLTMLKCEFGKPSLVYLGYIVAGGEVILNWTKHNTVIEVRRFLGVAKYWRKFIDILSSIAASLHALTSVQQFFHWGDVQHKEFDALKKKISSTPVLDLL